MDRLKQFGKTVIRVSLTIVAVCAYTAILIAPGLFIQDELLVLLWVGAVIFAMSGFMFYAP